MQKTCGNYAERRNRAMSFLKRQPSKLIRSALSLQAYKIVMKQRDRINLDYSRLSRKTG